MFITYGEKKKKKSSYSQENFLGKEEKRLQNES